MRALHRWKHDEGCRIGASAGCKSTGVKQKGIEYHRRVYAALKKWESEGWKLLVEPWFRNMDVYMMRQPDAVLVHEGDNVAIVIEVKLNWKDGRDEKLLKEYLPIVKTAFGLDVVWPALITRNIRGYKGKPLLGLGNVLNAMAWQPGDLTPLVLVP